MTIINRPCDSEVSHAVTNPLLLLQWKETPWNTEKKWLQLTNKYPSFKMKASKFNYSTWWVFLLVGLSLKARLKYLGRSFPSALPAVSNTPFSDQKNSIPSVQSDKHKTRLREKDLSISGCSHERLNSPARALGTSTYTTRSQSLLMPGGKMNYTVVPICLNIQLTHTHIHTHIPLMTPSSPGRPSARWMWVLFMRLRPCCWMELQLRK